MESRRVNKKPPASQKPKTSASSTGKQRVQEIYTPKDLVGSIVEKGFSSSSSPSNPQNSSVTSFPHPTVLPFPVARHRSHGPHWNPLHDAPEFKENELADDMDETDYAPISVFASPIERKEKKRLDFSSWRGLVSGRDSNSTSSQSNEKDGIPSEVKKGTVSTTVPLRNDEALKESSVSVKKAKSGSNMVCRNDESEMQFSQSNGLELTAVEEKLSLNGRETSMLMSSSQGFGSTMDDIHAENSARLNLMSSQEIADAQSEIIEKMNPAVVEMLKKRGREKLGNMKFGALEQENCGLDSHLPEADKNRGNDNVGSELPSGSPISCEMTAMHPDWVPAGQVHNNNWKIWSERVEKVRELRFSLEGNVMEVDSHQISSGCEAEGVKPDIGNVAERDLLRTEGDPAALGYSIKEVIELIRSMVPAQRALSLKLLDAILNKALFNLLDAKDEPNKDSNHVDWQAIWAYALGPEPQLVLSLRIALDDNHHSVVLACAKLIRSMLSCDMNENFFNVAERVSSNQIVLCTAPVFRSRPGIDSAFLQGGFWKYSTKPSNILPSSVDEDNGEEERTIQDDVVVAGQDISAGFVRMGILPRICYLLEMEPTPALVESLVSVLIGLARHSPACANSITQCPRLIQNVVNILTRQGMMEIPCQIKAVTMIKVLSQMDKRLCSNFVKDGIFQQVMWHWYRSPITIDQWVQYGKEHCKLTAALMVEQLRLWKVCISYGYCVAYFGDFFLQMCLWLSRPTFNKLLELNVLAEFAHITGEAFLTLGALAEWLPRLHSMDQLNKQGTHLGGDNLESWSWSHVVPVVDIAIHWLTLKDIPYVLSTIHCINENNDYNSAASSMIWVISAVLHMLYCVFDRISPPSSDDGNDSTSLPWLPDFVPKVGIQIVKNRFFRFNDSSGAGLRDTEGYSLVQRLCSLNHQYDFDMSLSSLSCLHELLRLASSVDKCIERARNACDIQLLKGFITEMDDKILADGIIKCAEEDLTRELNVFGNLVSFKWPIVQSLETFGRGGPAPGVGVGWGSPGGGFWSLNILQSQTAARLVIELIQILKCVPEGDQSSVEAMELTFQRVNWALAVCLVAGPGGRVILEGALSILFQPHVLKHLGFFLHRVIHHENKLKSFKWQYDENDYFLFSKSLNSHFRERWLSVKTKSSGDLDSCSQTHKFPIKGAALETIHESNENRGMATISFTNMDSSSCIKWAHQRLPIPMHWFLSAICRIGEQNNFDKKSLNGLDVARSGLFFLLCLEALSSLMFPNLHSPVLNVSLAWKLHALSMSLHVNIAVLEEEKSRDVFETLQELYGKQLDELRCKEKKQEFQSQINGNPSLLLSFQLQINEGYNTFVENLIEQFGAVSYGDIIFGRQVAMYLHRLVDSLVRLATWNALSNAHLLELLPPLELCFSKAEGYLEPPEDNDAILEAYAKSWTSGFLDRAFTRGSVSFSLAMHHLHSFIFNYAASNKMKLRNKLAKSLLRSYSAKHHNNEMLLHLVRYNLPSSHDPSYSVVTLQRFKLLKTACEGNSSLIAVVDSLKYSL